MTRGRALALVESPAQLLNVLELGASGAEWAGVRIVVLAPAQGQTREQLTAMAELALDAGHPVVWTELRRGGHALAAGLRTLAAELAGVDRLVVGDPFSGLTQVVASLIRPSRVVLVDDGTATLEFVRQWAAGEPLSRWHQVAGSGPRWQLTNRFRRRLARTVRRRWSPASGCTLSVFSCLPVELAGVAVRRNDYAWVRATYPSPTVKPGADLIGTSLVETGVVGEDAYVSGVAALAREHGVDRYLAHRKETDAKLARIAARGLDVVRPDLPLEIVARRGPVGRTMISFPSTVVHTLPVVLQDTEVVIKVRDIDEGWFTDRATQRADDFLDQVTRTARSRHGLSAVAA